MRHSKNFQVSINIPARKAPTASVSKSLSIPSFIVSLSTDSKWTYTSTGKSERRITYESIIFSEDRELGLVNERRNTRPWPLDKFYFDPLLLLYSLIATISAIDEANSESSPSIRRDWRQKSITESIKKCITSLRWSERVWLFFDGKYCYSMVYTYLPSW